MHINTPPTFQAAVLTSHNIFKDQDDIFSPPPLFSSLPPFFSKLKSEEKTTRKAEKDEEYFHSTMYIREL